MDAGAIAGRYAPPCQPREPQRRPGRKQKRHSFSSEQPDGRSRPLLPTPGSCILPSVSPESVCLSNRTSWWRDYQERGLLSIPHVAGRGERDNRDFFTATIEKASPGRGARSRARGSGQGRRFFGKWRSTAKQKVVGTIIPRVMTIKRPSKKN